MAENRFTKSLKEKEKEIQQEKAAVQTSKTQIRADTEPEITESVQAIAPVSNTDLIRTIRANGRKKKPAKKANSRSVYLPREMWDKLEYIQAESEEPSMSATIYDLLSQIVQ